MTEGHKGLAQSVMTRLNNYAKQHQVPFDYVLSRFGVERLLYRLSISTHSRRFVLKGATLMLLWLGDTARPTRDADLAGFGDLSETSLQSLFEELCALEVADAIVFDAATVNVTQIRRQDEYGGRRVTFVGLIGRTRVPVQIDIGIGDSVSPEPTEAELPALLDFPPPRLRAYRPETSIAEKLHALVTLGITNSRMKDYYDIDRLAAELSFDNATLADAIARTFEHRGTQLPVEVPEGLSDEFGHDADRQKLWRSFVMRVVPNADDELPDVVRRIRDFLMPVIRGVAEGSWQPGGPWQTSSRKRRSR